MHMFTAQSALGATHFGMAIYPCFVCCARMQGTMAPITIDIAGELCYSGAIHPRSKATTPDVGERHALCQPSQNDSRPYSTNPHLQRCTSFHPESSSA